MKGKQVALYMRPEVKKVADKLAKKEKISFSKYISNLVIKDENK